MATLPSEPEGTSQAAGGYDRTRASHLQRQVAEGFGADAGRYDRARPTYPADLVDRIIAASPGRDVLDVGCGTGISARLFQAAGCRVLGVDPDPRMAELARQGGTEVEVAKFEDWEPAGRSFDAVIAAQAWHWVEPVAGTAKAVAVLRPGGRLAVFWNAFDPPEDLREAFGEVFRRVLPDSPSGGFWDRPALDAYRAGCAGGRRDTADGGVRRAGGMAVLLGTPLHPGRVAGPGRDHRRLHPAPRAHPAGTPRRPRRRRRRGRRHLHHVRHDARATAARLAA